MQDERRPREVVEEDQQCRDTSKREDDPQDAFRLCEDHCWSRVGGDVLWVLQLGEQRWGGVGGVCPVCSEL